jgi:hypothetical protein
MNIFKIMNVNNCERGWHNLWHNLDEVGMAIQKATRQQGEKVDLLVEKGIDQTVADSKSKKTDYFSLFSVLL